MKITLPNNKYTSLLYIFSKNFLQGGIILGICLTLLELIKYNKSLIGYYAFVSASFFLVTLIQFYYIDKLNPKMNYTFLYHTMIGAIIWTLFSVILYVFYLKNLDARINILLVLLMIVLTWIIYYILLKNKII